jgi:hypothetical protein
VAVQPRSAVARWRVGLLADRFGVHGLLLDRFSSAGPDSCAWPPA